MKLKTRLTSIASLLTLAQLLSGCVLLPDPYTDTGPGPAIEPIEVGQTVEASLDTTDAKERAFNFDVFQFRGQPGTQVTVTARSKGPGTFIGLSHDEKLKLSSMYFAQDQQVYSKDLNGPHSEVIATLPPDEDGIYYVWLTGFPAGNFGPYSLSVVSGAVPSPDFPQAATAVAATSVSPNTAQPQQTAIATSVEPIYGNTGQYMCPFTEDGTVTAWVEKGMTAAIGANVGGAIGSYAGAKAMENVPFIGGFLGKKVGASAGRNLAINAAGGWEFIKANTDLSFNSLDDMARYMLANNATHPQYADVLKATYGIYPELQQSMAIASRAQ